MSPHWLNLCALEEIDDPGARGFVTASGESPLPGFLVRRGALVYGYVNICPHAGRPLNWKPDAFLTRDRSMILCSAHGALYEIATGLCVDGPCPGKSLRTIDTRVVDGIVQVARE